MFNPKVSICIPSYNHEKYIEKTIKSALAQTYKNFEIIISDDNSTDNTENVINRFKDPKIKFFKNSSNIGPSANFNKLIEIAEGEYLLFIASDDILYEDAIDQYLNKISLNNDLYTLVCWCQTIDENGLEVGSYNMNLANQKRDKNKFLNELFYKQNFLMNPGVFIKKQLFSLIKNFNLSLFQTHDLDLWVRILTSGFGIDVVEKKLIKYRIHQESLSNNGNNFKKNIIINSRYIFEIQQVLENYTKIDDFKLFLNTFPNVLKYPVVNEKYKYYYLMKEAFLVGNLYHSGYNIAYKLFSCNLAYKINQDPKMLKDLELNFGYNLSDFHNQISQIINLDNFNYFNSLIEKEEIKKPKFYSKINFRKIIKF